MASMSTAVFQPCGEHNDKILICWGAVYWGDCGVCGCKKLGFGMNRHECYFSSDKNGERITL